jgi:aminoglycoside phosphotransferase (APT) family kinase protein
LRVVSYEAITGGYSRAMAKVWVEDSNGRRGYVVRSDPPPGQSILDTDRSEEWAVLSALYSNGEIPMPAPRYFDSTGDELGSPSIVIDLVDGQALISLARSMDPSDYPTLTERLCQSVTSVHGFDLAGLPSHLDVPESWDDYIDGRIQRWIDAEAAHVEPNPFMRLIAAWLDANRPPPAPLRLVHGDFQLANVLVDQGGDFLLVDWELTHVGDPREDLGWWALAGVTQPPDLIAADEDAFYARYRELTGLSEEQLNPATVAYFTVLASDSVFISVLETLAGVAREETTAMTVAYMSNAVAGMHGVFWDAIARHDAILGGVA